MVLSFLPFIYRQKRVVAPGKDSLDALQYLLSSLPDVVV